MWQHTGCFSYIADSVHLCTPHARLHTSPGIPSLAPALPDSYVDVFDHVVLMLPAHRVGSDILLTIVFADCFTVVAQDLMPRDLYTFAVQ